MHIRKFWIRAVLGFLLFAIAVVLIVLAIMIPEFRRAARQRRAVESVEKLGGEVLFDWQLNGKSGPTTIHDFVRDYIGDPNLYAEVEHVDLTGTAASDADLLFVEEFSKMRWLIVSKTAITDSGLKELARKLPQCKIRR